MSKFDYIVLGLLLVSGIVGLARGAAREIAALAALLGAAAAAVFGFRFAGKILGRVMHPHWLAVGVAAVALFAAAYLVLRLAGAALARRVHKTDVLGALDRTVGLLFGLGRGLVVLGALYLMFTAATPPHLQPKWITGARTWPLAADMGRLLRGLAPTGLQAAGRMKPAFARALDGDRSVTEGYDARHRGAVDDLVVEKPR